MNFGGSRLGFWFRPPAPAGALANACSLFPDYTKADLDALGITPSNSQYLVNNNYIKYTINGANQGALGDGGAQYTVFGNGIGLMFDPTGTGNFGVDDYIKPGTPWEAYAVQAGSSVIGGSNNGTGGFSNDALVYNIGGENNHYVVLRGNNTVGWVIVQYMTFPGEAIIRIKMTYQNTTGSSKNVKMLRVVDPDVDVIQYGTYNTNNQRGFGSISGTDLVYSIGAFSGKPLSLYAPGNGYTHNTGVLTSWPTYDFDYILSGAANSSTGDDGIGAAWNIGAVADGATASVCCYYICGSNLADIIAAIGA